MNKYDTSKLARVRCPQDDPDESPTARNFLTLPPTGTPRRAISPGEGLPIFPTSPPGERPDCPSLRASDEHSFIVRVLRARRMVWLLPSCSSETARCASTGDSPGHPSSAGGLFQRPASSVRSISNATAGTLICQRSSTSGCSSPITPTCFPSETTAPTRPARKEGCWIDSRL